MVAHSRGSRDARAARRLNEPRPAPSCAPTTRRRAWTGLQVARVREEWRVVERWWTSHPVRRRYFDVVLETGENAAVFLDERAGRWYRQRA